MLIRRTMDSALTVPVPATIRLLCALLAGVMMISACARHELVAPTAVASDAHGPTVLRPLPASGAKLTTSGHLRENYRGDSLFGGPMPYEEGVDSSLLLCAGTGPLFGACAGILVGALAVAGIGSTVVDKLQEGPEDHSVGTRVEQAVMPDTVYAASLSERIAAEAVAEAGRGADLMLMVANPATDSCAAVVADTVASMVTDIEIVGVELAFEAGFQFRLIVIARLRSHRCGADQPATERRLAYRGRLQALSREPSAAARMFDAEMAAAVAQLGQDVANTLAGRPRG